jgi:hypothetical protein
MARCIFVLAMLVVTTTAARDIKQVEPAAPMVDPQPAVAPEVPLMPAEVPLTTASVAQPVPDVSMAITTPETRTTVLPDSFNVGADATAAEIEPQALVPQLSRYHDALQRGEQLAYIQSGQALILLGAIVPSLLHIQNGCLA